MPHSRAIFVVKTTTALPGKYKLETSGVIRPAERRCYECRVLGDRAIDADSFNAEPKHPKGEVP